MAEPDLLEVDPVISALYEATLDPARWGAALASMARLGDAQAAVFVDMDYAQSVLWRHVLFNVDEEAHHIYLQRYAQIDPRLPVMMRSPEMHWVSDREALSDEIRLGSPVYREYLLPCGLQECLMAKLAVENARHGNVVLLRVGGAEAFSQDRRATLDLLLPHLDRAIRISRRLAAFARALAFGSRGVESSPEPVAAIAGNGRLSEANPAFDALLATGSVFRLGAGQVLRCVSADAQLRFKRAFMDALALAKGNLHRPGVSPPVLALDRADGPPLLVTVAPLMQLGGRPWFEELGVLIKVTDPLAPPSEAVLQQGFGLTGAEARLACAMLGGGPLADVAARVGVSTNTAKTQLQGIFQKTRTSRQAELVALLRSIQH